MAWGLVGAVVAIDVLWGVRIGLSIRGTWTIAAAAGLLLALSEGYRRRSRAIANMAEEAALWVAFSAAACVLTYLCATCALPLQDARLSGFDRAIGFDWQLWQEAVLRWPAVRWVLALAYASLMPQIVLAVLYFPAAGRSERARELVTLAVLTLVPTAVISALCPVLGPWEGASFLPHLLALRGGGRREFDVGTLQGIVQMPSYHTILAVLFTYAFRGTGKIGWGIAGLNAVMLPSIPPFGGHYLADVVAGGTIALLGILGWRWGAGRASRMPVVAGRVGTHATPG